MPPFVPRKREHSPHPTPPKKRAAAAAAKPKHNPVAVKSTLFDDADAPIPHMNSAAETKSFLDSLDDDEASSLSEIESDEFEDVPTAEKWKTTQYGKDESDDGEDDEMDWEDAMGVEKGAGTASVAERDLEINDISITMNDDGSYVEPDIQERTASARKGPSKRERQARNLTHCLHVQCLLWHNTVRNSWLNDETVQKTLVDAVPTGVKREITRWREAMGTMTEEEIDAKKREASSKSKGKKGKKSKDQGRDWTYGAQHSSHSVPNLSTGDPLLRLLKVLTAYWRKRFAVTAPAFRKRGYMPLKRLRHEIRHWEKNRDDAEDHGERIENIQAFRKLAKKCEGSRDVGGQLFAALLRGIGLDTRMVANLQPAGIGWSKAEEANEKKVNTKVDEESEDEAMATQAEKGARKPHSKNATVAGKAGESLRKSASGNQPTPIKLDESDSALSEPPSEFDQDDVQEEDIGGDDLSVIDITPELPKRKTMKKYDRDLAFPTYWTEVCSPISHKYIPVDPIVLSTIASNDDLLQTFEPRGKRAELAKQVICYVTAFSADGTAKDVTVRYLKKHQLPGKTKGMRMPTEKVAIYNKRGKVRKYEEYDWFRTVMSLYDRPERMRTAADDLEEQTDLKPLKPQQEGKEIEKESLQWYKQSAEFVLEQHLRREEAIIPGAQLVKTFIAGKGDKAKEHDVYRRQDVVSCKTVESWHKEGRAIKTGEQPIKHVPMRAVTIIKKREIEEAERETGEKVKQGLYSRDQTDWIIPPPIEDGVIPKNAYGNMDVYVETMVPKGAVHLKLKGTAKICRKLEIDYAEACTGFEFGKQRAVPVLTGVVVAEENAQMVREAWRAEQEEIKRKEDTKRTATSLHWWRKMLMGMRIIERMRSEYENTGIMEEEINPFVGKAKREGRDFATLDTTEAGGGGFFLPGEEDDNDTAPGTRAKVEREMEGGFLPDSDDGDGGMALDGGFLMEEDPADAEVSRASTNAPVTPISLQSLHNADADDREAEQLDEEADNVRDPAPNKSSSHATNKHSATKGTHKAVKCAGRARGRRRSHSSIPTPPSDEDEDIPEPTEPSIKPMIRGKPRTKKRATPKRSQYFVADDGSAEEEDSSSEEIVKPKRTTARTRRVGD